MNKGFSTFILGVLCFGLLALNAAPVSAQEPMYKNAAPYKAPIPPTRGTTQLRPDNSNMADIRYRHLVEKLLFDEPAQFNFMELRIQYYQTNHYDPLGEKPVQRMQDLAYLIQTEKNPAKIVGHTSDYMALLHTHIANITVVNQAISLSKQDSRFGNTKQLERIKKGLFDSVLMSGDGMTLHGAYDVITMDEEIMLLRHLKYEVQATHDFKTGLIRYNMHYIIERGTDNTYAIFVDTTIPITHLERIKNTQGPTVTLRKR